MRSGALEMPKGSLLKHYLPDVVINVVNRRKAGSRGVCQGLLFASSLLKSLAPVSWARVSSTLGRGGLLATRSG